jgi:hypothetical protein
VVLIAPGLREYYVADVEEQWREADEAIKDVLSGCASGREHFWLVLRDVPRFNRHLTEFLFKRNHKDMNLIGEKEFTGVSVYLFAVDRVAEVDRSDAYAVL